MGSEMAGQLAFTTNSGLKAHCVAWQTWLHRFSAAKKFAAQSASDQPLSLSSTSCTKCCGAAFDCSY